MNKSLSSIQGFEATVRDDFGKGPIIKLIDSFSQY